MADKTSEVLKSMKAQNAKLSPLVGDMILPNYSGIIDGLKKCDNGEIVFNMKKILYIIATTLSIQVSAQETNYSDSSITLVLTQRTAYWVGAYIKNRFEWSERNAPTQLRNYIGSGADEDSVFTVTFKSKYLLS